MQALFKHIFNSQCVIIWPFFTIYLYIRYYIVAYIYVINIAVISTLFYDKI
jgi:hypothetical protein